MNYIRLNNICLDLREIECIEWKKTEDDENATNHLIYRVQIHTKTSKMYTRLLFEAQFKLLKDRFRHYINGTIGEEE